jgi:ABC-type multidrug transport system fused ATPase/permease subunit
MIGKLYLDFVKNNKLIFLIYFITLLFIPIQIVLLPKLYTDMITTIKGNNINFNIFKTLLLIWILIQILQTISESIVHYNILPRFKEHVRNFFTSKVLDHYEQNYKELNSSDVLTHLVKIPELFEEYFHLIEDFIFKNLLIIISSFIFLYMYNEKIGIVYLICMLFLISICYVYKIETIKYVNNREKSEHILNNEIEDIVSNMLSIYTASKKKSENNRIEKYNKILGVNESKSNIYDVKYRFIFSLYFIIVFLIINYLTLNLYRNGEINISSLKSIIIINYSILTSFMWIYSETKDFIDMSVKHSLFTDYIDNLPKRIPNKSKLLIDKKINIKLEKVYFEYKKNIPTINNISLTINHNEKIGIFGRIGSGKSTLGKLLVRLFKINSGNIFLNKYNLYDIEINNLRNNICYIPQHPKLFNRSLYENITYGINKKINIHNVLNILKENNLHDLYYKFNNMLHKKVGFNGSLLSGGQKQVVWLLRSLIGDNKIIIMDEPTSSLDKVSKNKIIQLINVISKNKTLIIITHDDDIHSCINRKITLSNGTIISDVML